MNKVYEIMIGALISKLISFVWDKLDKQIEKKINDRLSRKGNGR